MAELNQLLKVVAETIESLQRTQEYLTQMGDLITFITETARDAWKDVPQIIEGFRRAGIR